MMINPQRCTKPSSHSCLSAFHVGCDRAERKSTQQKTLPAAGVNVISALVKAPADIRQIATTLIQQTMHQAHRAGHIFDGVFCRCQSCITSVTAAINLQGLQRKVQPGYECTTACLIATFGVTKAASVANLSISAHTCCPILKFHA